MSDTSPELSAEIETYERKHAEQPEGRYFVPLANAYRKSGQLEQAEDVLREGLKHQPDYLSAHIVLGRVLRERGVATDAESEFRHVLDADPQNLVALRSLGEIAAAGGRDQESAGWYERLLAVDPLNEDARAALDTLRAPRGAGEEAPVGEPGFGTENELASQPEFTNEAEVAPDFQTSPEASREESEEPGLYTGWGQESAPASDDQPDVVVEGLTTPAGEPLGAGKVPDSVEPEELGVVTFDQPLELDDNALLGEPAGRGEESAAEAGEEDDGVVTETIAELYARQGLYLRAAAVYRKLLADRSEDAELSSRLEELELLAAANPEEPPAIEPGEDALEVDELTFAGEGPAEEGPQNGGDDPFALSFEHGFEGSAEGQEPPAPEAESAEPAAAVARGETETIGGYLGRLLDWSPGDAGEPAPAGPEPAAGQELEEAGFTPLEGEFELSSAEPVGDTDDEPWAEFSAPEADVAPPDEARAEVEREAEPEEAEGGWSFDDFFSAGDTSDSEGGATSAPEDEDNQGGDDDLESFQAWLQSLKK